MPGPLHPGGPPHATRPEAGPQARRTVERGYADLKQHRGLRIFRCFGRKRAHAQAGLVILASNGLNLLRALQRRQDDGQPHAPPEKQPP